MLGIKEYTIKYLNDNKLDYKLCYFEEKVFTISDVGRVTKLSESQIGKCLVLKKQSGAFFLYLLPGDQRVDPVHLAFVLKERKVRFANEIEIKEITKCDVGAVTPFAPIWADIRLYIDSKLLSFEFINVSTGDLNFGLNVPLNTLKAIPKSSLIYL